MANTLRFKRGLVAGIPTGVAGEPLFTTDTFDLYIGNGTTNTRFQKYIASGTTLQYLRGDGSLATFPTNIVTGTGVSGQVAYWSGTNTQTGNANLIYDAANNRLRLGGGADTSQRLQVTGDTLLKGSGNTSATTALTVQNSDGTALLRVLNSNLVLLQNIFPLSASTLNIYHRENVNNAIVFTPNAATTLTSGTRYTVITSDNFTPTSGNASFATQLFQPTINQTGGANGITRGLYVNPTLTAAADWRSIEWSNNTGWGLYGAGTANNYLAGSLGIGTTSLTGYSLRVEKSITGAATNVFSIYQNSSVQSDVTGTANGIGSFTGISGTTTLSTLRHFVAAQGTFSAGGTVSSQIGFAAASTLTSATNNYGFYGDIASGTGRWNLYMNGTANNYMAGSLGIGITTPSTDLHISKAGSRSLRLTNSTNSTDVELGIATALGTVGTNTANAFAIVTSNTERMRITPTTGNVHIGTFVSDSGEKLQVNGTMKVTGASTFSSNITSTDGTSSTIVQTATNAPRIVLIDGRVGGRRFDLGSLQSGAGTFSITDNTAGLARFTIASDGSASFSSNVTSGGNLLLTNGNAGTIGAINLVRTGTSPVASRLTFGTDGTGYSFAIGKNQAGTVTDLFSILDSGAANFTTSIQAATAIAIGTTPDTNKPFKILKNINATVGINFENTSTSSLAFSAIQMGTDVTGGTKFTNLVYASSGVTANGVYNPDGTSLINNGGGGLNFLGTPTRFYTGGGNGVLRLLHDNEGTTQFTATTPTTNATDGYRQYSADVVAGNAAPHFRTENGAVIKLYQETTGVGNAIISLGGGSSVLDDTTFDGYTLRQIVKALRNQGILA